MGSIVLPPSVFTTPASPVATVNKPTSKLTPDPLNKEVSEGTTTHQNQSQPIKPSVRSKEIQRMQEWLQSLHNELISFTKNETISNMVSKYITTPGNPKTSLIERMKHLTGFGSAKHPEMPDGVWGNKTEQALKSTALITHGILAILKQTGANVKGFSDAEYNQLVALIKDHKTDPNKRAAEISKLLSKLNETMTEFISQASGATKQIGQGIKAPVQDIGQKALNWITEKGADFKLPNIFIALNNNQYPVPLSAIQNLQFFSDFLKKEIGDPNISPSTKQYKDIINQLISQCQQRIQAQQSSDKNPHYNDPGY